MDWARVLCMLLHQQIPYIMYSCDAELNTIRDFCCWSGSSSCCCAPGDSGPLNRDVVISQTAAAMIAWFQQQLQPKPAAAAGLQPVVAAAPLASAALHAAAQVQHSISPAAEAEGSSQTAAGSSSSMLEGGFSEAFQQWVKSPMVAEHIRFTVK